MVGDVELIILQFIIGSPIFAFPKNVISTTILIPVLPDCGGNGRRVAYLVIVAICRVCIFIVGICALTQVRMEF